MDDRSIVFPVPISKSKTGKPNKTDKDCCGNSRANSSGPTDRFRISEKLYAPQCERDEKNQTKEALEIWQGYTALLRAPPKYGPEA